jgi:hypothetical protein
MEISIGAPVGIPEVGPCRWRRRSVVCRRTDTRSTSAPTAATASVAAHDHPSQLSGASIPWPSEPTAGKRRDQPHSANAVSTAEGASRR